MCFAGSRGVIYAAMWMCVIYHGAKNDEMIT